MKYKQNILRLGLILGSGLPLLTLIGCSIFSTSDIGLVTDAGSIFDKSFNESAWLGIKKVVVNPSESQDAIQPERHNPSDLVNAYSVLVAGRKKYIVAPGFYHVLGINAFNHEGYADKVNFILLDAEIPASNVASVTYETAAAGFLAGYLSSSFLVARGDNKPKIGTWGGGNFPGVTNFMVGLVYGTHYFNTQNSSTPVRFAKFHHDAQYTDSGFNSGGGKDKALFLVNEGAQVIFPVAGPQIADVFTAINQSPNKRQKIIGVDSNAVDKFPNQKHLFLTSVIKDLTTSVKLVYKKMHNQSVPDFVKGLGETTVGSLENNLTNITNNLNDGGWDEISPPQRLKIYNDTIALKTKAIAEVKDKSWNDALNLIRNSL